MRERKGGNGKQDVSARRAEDASGNLGHHVQASFSPAEPACKCLGHGNHRVQMSAGNWPERKNQRGERSRCRNRVGQKRNRNVSGGKPVSHDAGTDDGRHQECRAKKFRGEAARKWNFHRKPIRSISFLMASPARVASGRLRKSVILRSSVMNASRNARSTCSAEPFTA